MSISVYKYLRLLGPVVYLWAWSLAASDELSPVLTEVSPQPGVVSNLVQVILTFNEPVLDVDAADLLVDGIPALAVTNAGNVFGFTVPPRSPGEVLISWAANHGISDYAGNAFDSSAQTHTWAYVLVDVLAPDLAVVSPTPGATLTRLDTVEILFNEPVVGIQAGDLLINGAKATNVTGVGAGPYQFRFSPPAEGPVVFSWESQHGISDTAEPVNFFAAPTWTNLLTGFQLSNSVIISEFLANNVAGLTNEFGQAEDWIELHNSGTNIVSLLGWSLTDDPDHLKVWTFPDIALQPGEYLVVFADGRDLKNFGPGRYLHTNFKLNEQGDYLALCGPDFPRRASLSFAPEFPEQRPDYSYGLTPGAVWAYFALSTPGMANGESLVTGVTPQPQVNAQRGLYDHPFTLVASCSARDAQIRYTVDGSTPTEMNGFTFTDPLVVTNTLVFRMAAFSPNRLPSQVVTHSYLFLDEILRQPRNPAGYPYGTNVWSGLPSDYQMDPEIVTNNLPAVKDSLAALPTLCLSMKVDDLFGPVNGIYTHPEPPASSRSLWERPCSVEFVLTNGQTGFQVNCGIRIQGNASRTPLKTPKHSFRLLFKDAYGPGRLDYPLFLNSPVKSFNGLVLRADYNNSWLHSEPNQRLRGSLARDPWGKETFRAMNGLSGHSRPFHLYLNGLYWGVYNFGERVDAEFAASYLGGNAAEWDAVVSKPTEAIDGDLSAYNAMVNIGRRSDMTFASNYMRIQQYLDMPVFLDYMILNFYGANLDWGSDGNWNAIRRRAPGQTFKYVVWDAEQLLVNNNDSRVTSGDLPSGLHTNLVRSSQYRLDFADRVHKYCFDEGVLTPRPAAERWMQIASATAQGVLSESARWGDYRRDVHPYASPPYYLYTTNAHWWPEIRRMQTNYFPARTAIFLNQLRAAGLYPAVTAPVFSQHGGHIARGFELTISSTNPIIYTLNGNDPRVPFTGAVAPDALIYTGGITIASSLTVKARSLSGTNWSALAQATFATSTFECPLHVSEFMYQPVGGVAYEFLELRHDGDSLLDVSGWTFDGISFTFPVGTTLAPGQVLLLANNTDTNAFTSRYGAVRVFGYYSGRLRNEGERIALLDASGRTMMSLDYGNASGWPPGPADGSGYSLESVGPLADPDSALSWYATNFNGTPGVVPSTYNANSAVLNHPSAPVRLNEIMAENRAALNNNGSFPDWIELYNDSGNPLDLGNWSLTDDVNARKFVFPSNTFIAANGYLLVWCDTNASLPGLHSGFMLERSGETLALYNVETSRVDVLTYGLQVIDYSLCQLSNTWVLGTPTPGAANLPAPLASPTNLCINEWLANAPPGGSDWLELFNSAAEPVSLAGLFLVQSNGAHHLRSLSFVPGRGYVQLFADAKTGGNHLDFKLSGTGASVALYGASGMELDRISYGPQLENASQGRLPDGSATIADFRMSQSPAAPNYLPAYAGPGLNEVLASNHRSLTNQWGHTPDWVELSNPLPTSFDLSGFRLSTAYDNPLQWVFPAGVIIPPQGHLVVSFNPLLPTSLTNEPGLNNSHALNGAGDGLHLFDARGYIVDQVIFGPQASDYSIGRVSNVWTLLARPTPGAANSEPAGLGTPSRLQINEWFVSPEPFFELFNSSTQPVELTGLFLSDDLSKAGETKFQIAPLSYIGPGGFTAFKPDAARSEGLDHVNFTLEPETGSIRLSSSGLGIINTVWYGSQTAGHSEGRLPDGGSALQRFSCPTPSTSNSLSASILIDHPPTSQVSLTQGNATFEVAISGGAVLGYQWLFNEAPIPGANAGTLQITNVSSTNAGSYALIVSNSCNSVTSAVATLTVLLSPGASLPSIVAHPLSRTNTVGESVSFNVLAQSPFPVTYQWLFNDAEMAFETNATLRLRNVTVDRVGIYQVQVRNQAGAVMSGPAYLNIVPVPQLRQALLLESGELQFTVEGQPFRQYVIEWSEDLNTWSMLQTFSLSVPVEVLTRPDPMEFGTAFYRLRLLP